MKELIYKYIYIIHIIQYILYYLYIRVFIGLFNKGGCKPVNYVNQSKI